MRGGGEGDGGRVGSGAARWREPRRWPADSPAAALIGLAAALLLIGAVFWLAATAGAALLPPAAAEFEVRLMLALAELRTPLLDLVFVEITLLGSQLAGATLLLWSSMLLWIHRHRIAVAFLWVAFVGSTLLSGATKALVGRTRPDVIEWLVPRAETAAFPSGHGIRSVTIFLALAFVIGRIAPIGAVRAVAWVVALGTAVLVGGSRVYLGVHYPSDVLGGYVLGLAWLAACALLAPPPTDRRG